MSYYHLLHGMQTKAPVYNGKIMQKKGWCVHWRKIGRGNKATHKMYAIFISITKNAWWGQGSTIENNNQNSMACKTRPHAQKNTTLVL